MKKLFISAIFASLMLCFSICAQASLLSPGLSVIQKSVTMEKKGVAKNTVTFSAEDFEEALGMKDIGDIRITSLRHNQRCAKLGGDILSKCRYGSLSFCRIILANYTLRALKSCHIKIASRIFRVESELLRT